MYYYSFERFYGFDRVVKLENDFSDVFPGDLIKAQDTYFLCLWEDISFQEQYKYVERFSKSDIHLIYSGFMSHQFLSLLHWMVYYNYTSYKSVMKLFFPADISALLQREVSGKVRKNKKNFSLDLDISAFDENKVFSVCDDESLLFQDIWSWSKNQILYIFPDIWTLKNMIDEEYLSHKKSVILHSMNSAKQKDLAWWNIKKNKVQFIFSTPGEVFQDYKSLSKIYFIFPHKWYYSNQQDPRYKMEDIVKIFSLLYWCEVFSLW